VSAANDTTPPVVVVVRHPDYANDITVYGGEVRVIEADLGGSFDMSASPDEYSADEALETADWLEESVSDLPADHPARGAVASVAADIRAWAREEER
jgi:hypothetical protein